MNFWKSRKSILITKKKLYGNLVLATLNTDENVFFHALNESLYRCCLDHTAGVCLVDFMATIETKQVFHDQLSPITQPCKLGSHVQSPGEKGIILLSEECLSVNLCLRVQVVFFFFLKPLPANRYIRFSSLPNPKTQL